MRLSLGLLVIGSVALVACSGSEGTGSIRRANGSEDTAGIPPVDPNANGTPAAASCPSTVPVARAISTSAANASDVHIVLGDVIYRDAHDILRVDRNGARTQIYRSPDLAHAFADESVLVTIESPNPPYAVVKVGPIGPTTGAPPGADGRNGPVLTVTPPGWNAGGTHVFASDETSLYVMADVDTLGETIYKVEKANPSQMTVLAQIDGAVLSDPQLAANAVWFVRDQKRVYKVGLPADPEKDPIGLPEEITPPVEVFGSGYASCKLAVGRAHAFCSTGNTLEQRDLSGANLLTVLDAYKGAAPSLLGAATFRDDTVFVRTLPSSATDLKKNGIRAVKAGGATQGESLLACGRETITAIAVDATSVVWAEQGKGVFQAPR